MTAEPGAAGVAARQVDTVRDDPAGRYAMAARFYRSSGPARRRYGAAELSFLRWELSRGVLASVDGDPPGSPWWRAVNERLLRDKAEADLLATGLPGTASADSVELWVDFLKHPGAGSWYRAHNSSIVSAYLAHEASARKELQVERFMMNVALLRVLFTHALVAQPRLALGPLAPLGPLLADPRGPTVGLFLDLRRSFPSHYPLRLTVAEAMAREQWLARALDYGVIAPRLGELYAFSAASLRQPHLRDLLDRGAPAYAWSPGERHLWDADSLGRPVRALAWVTGVRGPEDGRSG
jgi:hypothetical protein